MSNMKQEMERYEQVAEGLDVLYPELGADFRRVTGLPPKNDDE